LADKKEARPTGTGVRPDGDKKERSKEMTTKEDYEKWLILEETKDRERERETQHQIGEKKDECRGIVFLRVGGFIQQQAPG